jgi:hypothetical protein
MSIKQCVGLKLRTVKLIKTSNQKRSYCFFGMVVTGFGFLAY